jgi:hypothetical protein
MTLRQEVAGDERKLYNEENHVLYSPVNVVWVIKPRKLG